MKKRRKRTRRSLRYSSSNDSGGSSTDDAKPYKCKAAPCKKRFKHKSELKFHLEECPLYYGDANPTPWGVCSSDMASYNVVYHSRNFTAFHDDALNSLHPARWIPMTSTWIQAHVAQPVVAKPVHYNYPWIELGIPLANYRLVCNMAYMSFR